MCYCPTPTLHLNLALTGDGAFQLPPQKTYSVWFISILNYGDTENVLINHLLLVIPMLYPCHYTNLCPHKPHKHAHTHTHTLSREMRSRTQMQRKIRVLIIKWNKWTTKTTPKGENKQAGRRLEHSQHETHMRHTKDNGSAQDCRHKETI